MLSQPARESFNPSIILLTSTWETGIKHSFRVRICNARNLRYITTMDFTCKFGSNTWIKFIKSFNYCLFVTRYFIINDKCIKCSLNSFFLLMTSLITFQDFASHFHMIQICHHNNLFHILLIIYLILSCNPCIYWHYILSGVSGKSHKVCF